MVVLNSTVRDGAKIAPKWNEINPNRNYDRLSSGFIPLRNDTIYPVHLIKVYPLLSHLPISVIMYQLYPKCRKGVELKGQISPKSP